MNSEAVLGLANYEVTSIEHNGTVVRITARYLGSVALARIAKVRSCGAKAGISGRCGTRAGDAALLVDPGKLTRGCAGHAVGDSGSNFPES